MKFKAFVFLIFPLFLSCEKEELENDNSNSTTEQVTEDVIDYSCMSEGVVSSFFDSLMVASEITDGFTLNGHFGDFTVGRSADGQLDSLTFGTNNPNDLTVNGNIYHCLGNDFFIAVYKMTDEDFVVQNYADTVYVEYTGFKKYISGGVIGNGHHLMFDWINWGHPNYDNHYGYFLK